MRVKERLLCPPIRNREFREILAKAKQGDHASADIIVMTQGGLVRNLANHLLGRIRQILPSTVADRQIYAGSAYHDVDDMIQEGMIGVFESIRYFDPDRGCVFSTYAGGCAARRMNRWAQSPKVRPFAEQDVTPGDGISLMQFIEGRLVVNSSQEDFYAVFNQLAVDEQTILRWRHGLGGLREANFRQIGLKLGISSQEAENRYASALLAFGSLARIAQDKGNL